MKKLEDLNVLFFGDSNTSNYFKCKKYHVEKHPGLKMFEPMFNFHLQTALQEDQYDLIVICIGGNDIGDREPIENVKKGYQNLKRNLGILHVNNLIVGPYSPDLDISEFPTMDGLHLHQQMLDYVGILLSKKIELLNKN